MRTTFLVLNLDGSVDVKKLNKFLYENVVDFELVVACNTKYKGIKTENVVECIFDDNAKPDEVLNTLIPKCGGQNLVLARKIENNNFAPLLEVAKNLKDQNQVVVIKKKNNVFTKFFKMIFSYFVRFLYGYELFDSNLSVMSFGEVPFTVLRQTENCSTFTKINKWGGLEVVEIEGECPKVNLSEHKWTRFVRLGAYITVFIAIILSMSLIPSFFEPAILKVGGIGICIFTVLLSIVDLTIILASHFVGGNTFKSAILLQVLEQEQPNQDEKKAKPKTKKTKATKTAKTTKRTKNVKESKDE